MIAITGATGHTGRLFMEALSTIQHVGTVRCMVRSSEKVIDMHHLYPDAEVLIGNLDSQQDIKTFLTGVDTVIHLANIRYSPDIVTIGKACGVKRFILIHTTGIYSKFKTASQEYIWIENQITPFMEELHITILRPTMIFGDMCDHNISKFIRFVDKFPVLPAVAGGRSLVQPVNARDLAKAIVQVLQSDCTVGKAYNVSGEKPITVRQLYQMIGQFLGQKKAIIGIPLWICVLGAKVLKLFTFGRIDILEKVQRMSENRGYNHDLATMDFGYLPEKFEMGLQREVDEYITLTKRHST